MAVAQARRSLSANAPDAACRSINRLLPTICDYGQIARQNEHPPRSKGGANPPGSAEVYRYSASFSGSQGRFRRASRRKPDVCHTNTSGLRPDTRHADNSRATTAHRFATIPSADSAGRARLLPSLGPTARQEPRPPEAGEPAVQDDREPRRLRLVAAAE
jgi:hypothetical protein